MEVCHGVLMPNGPDSDIRNWIASPSRSPVSTGKVQHHGPKEGDNEGRQVRNA